jgi:hypothetical protein
VSLQLSPRDVDTNISKERHSCLTGKSTEMEGVAAANRCSFLTARSASRS